MRKGEESPSSQSRATAPLDTMLQAVSGSGMHTSSAATRANVTVNLRWHRCPLQMRIKCHEKRNRRLLGTCLST